MHRSFMDPGPLAFVAPASAAQADRGALPAAHGRGHTGAPRLVPKGDANEVTVQRSSERVQPVQG